jgi:MerC mercury resistance protein
MACAVHCALVPVLLTLLPSIPSLRWFSDPLFHQMVAVVCGVIVLRSLLPSVRIHGDHRPLALAFGGMSLLFLSAFVLPDSCCPMPSTQSHLQMPKVTLVSTASAIVKKEPSKAAPVAVTLSGRMLTVDQLIATIGYECTQILVDLNRYFTPLGGVLLIAAHLWNLGRRVCNDVRCTATASA